MLTREVLSIFPKKQIRALDGMALTAEVWEEAHTFHRQVMRLHTVLQHGPGILMGLEVIASDPPDNAVYLMPGLAIDSLGQPIAVVDPRSYDLGSAEGRLFLIASYTESRPQSASNRVQEDEPLYIQYQYTLEAVTELPATPHVELARIWRRDGKTPITVAKDPNHPRANEIDLRYRNMVGHQDTLHATVGVISLRGTDGARHGEGMANLAASIRLSGIGQVVVDRGVPLAGDLRLYDLIYLVGRDQVQLTNDEMTALYGYWQSGGIIFYEGCRHDLTVGEPPADNAFIGLVNAFGQTLKPIDGAHGVFAAPYLFAQPPLGFETQGSPTLRVADGILMSSYDYGCLWRGERRGRPAQRSEIRDAQEFGANLIFWAAAQRKVRANALSEKAS